MYRIALYCIVLYLKVQHLIKKLINENYNNWKKSWWLQTTNFRMAWAKLFKEKTRENPVKPENSMKIK